MSRRVIRLVSLVSVLSVLAGLASADINTGLVGYWPLDGDALDFSGNGLHGTINGEVIPVEDRSGNASGAMLFPGASDSHIDVGDPPELRIAGEMTLAAWVMLDSANANNGRIFSKMAGGGSRSWSLNIEASAGDAANPGTFQVASDGNTIVGINDPDPLPTDEWVHLAGVYKPGAAMELYVNGQLKVSRAAGVPASQFSDNGSSALIGGRNACGNCGWMGAIDEVRIYNRALTAGDVGEALRGDAAKASDPDPAGEAVDVPRDTALTWTAGEFADTHDLYLGTVFADVNNASRANPMDLLLSQGQADTTYDPPGALDFGQTYHWRVDEVNAPPDNTIFKGDLWTLTVEPLAYPIENIMATSNGSSDAGTGPENTVNGSGLNDGDQHSIDAPDMWLASPGAEPLWIQYEFERLYKLHEMRVWNYNSQFELVLGFGIKDVTVEYSTDGAEWMVLGDVELARATATADYAANTTVDLAGIAAQYVRLMVNSGYGMLPQFGLSEVRFFQIPTVAREPQPADGATQVDPGAVLSWRAGREAAAHDVYLGTNPDALPLVDTLAVSTYAPGTLEFGATVYWRIDEVNEAEVPGVWQSDLWNFSTLQYIVIDDFESYDDDEDRIYDIWLDGFVNETGATVGYFDAPFAERSIVNSGSQSMPLEYINDAAPFYSEAERDLGSMDIDTNGADTLRLFVAGQAPAFAETAAGSILVNGIGADIWGAADECRYAYRNLTGDGSITARVDALDGSPSSWAKGGVMIRQGAGIGAVNVFMAMTGGDGGGATFQQRMLQDNASLSQHTYADGPLAPPYWVRVTRQGDTLMGFTSPDGETWTQRGDTVTLAMTDPVLIGLALTSHNVDQATSAEFSNVSFTGNVATNWEIAPIGVTQPEGNDVAPLYVALEDTNGNMAVVTHPDASITARSGWTEWLIPYSDLAGVNLSRVARMVIGIGDRDNPTAGGAGLIFIDDIAYGHPATVE